MSVGIAFVVALTASPTHAQDPVDSAAPADSEAVDPTTDEARALYQEGVAAYASSDYERSVDLLRRSYEKALRIESEDVRAVVLTTLSFNLARAQVKAYDIDGDLRRLKQAKDLIEKYLSVELTEQERAEAEAVAQDIDDRITAAEAKAASAPSNTQPQATPGDTERNDARSTKGGRPLIITGGVLAGIGVVAGGALVGAGGALGARGRSDFDAAQTYDDLDEARSTHATGRILGFSGIAAGGVLTITGVALLAVGIKRERAGQTAARTRFQPSLGGLALRF